MPLDSDVFDKARSFEDYNRAEQEFQLKKQAASIDNQAKQLSLVGQVVGNSAVDQPSYDQARSYANKMGIDTSFLPDQYDSNIVNRLRFAGATPTAQLSAMLQQQQMSLRAGTAIGNVGAFGYGGNASQPTTAPIQSSPKPNPANQVQAGTPQGTQAINDLYGDNAPSQPVVLTQPGGQPVADNTQPPVATGTPQFSFRGQKAGETIDAYKAAQQQAFEQFKLNNTGPLKEVETAATKTGEHIGDAGKTLDIMQSNLPTVLERFQNMRSAANQASSGFGINEEGTGWKQSLQNSDIGSTDVGIANQKLKQYAAQGILPELGPQLAQAGIRGNKFLETLASSASGLDLAASPQAKQSLIDGLENTYIRNLKATAEQLRAKGQQAPSDADIDAAVAQLKQKAPQQSGLPDGAALYGTSKGKNVYKLPNGSFIMEQ